MFVEVKSILSDAIRFKEIDVNLAQVRAWQDGALIQDAMPNISAEERDFFKGIFWDEAYPDDFDMDKDDLTNSLAVDMLNPVAAYLRDRDNESS